MESVSCPKCGSTAARYTKTHCDVFLECRCGYCKLVATTLGGLSIEHIQPESEVALPRVGTKLMYCLGAVYSLSKATTQEIAVRLNQNNSDTASQLTVLRYKGLCSPVVNKRGVVGGSTWVVSDIAKTLLGRMQK